MDALIARRHPPTNLVLLWYSQCIKFSQAEPSARSAVWP
jgi:hypothetical protein